jgi:EAL domain-containing protein (putative c-di-GMP-specific phosphodiesterase class I)
VIANGANIEENKQWVLEAMADANRGWLVTVGSFPFIIGRDEECDLKLIDARISRRHCEIRRSGAYLWVRDLESKNGTFINNKPIKQAELLEPGDIISIGLFDFNIKNVKSNIASVAEETQDMEDFSKEVDQLSSLEPKLKTLLSNRDVIPHFQPILKFSDMAVAGYEILGRIPDGDLPSNPAELLDLAQVLGHAPELSALFREVGVDLGRNLPGTPKLFVNTTPMEVYHMNDLFKSLEKIYDIDHSNRIVLEVNEKAITSTTEMSRLRKSLEKLNMGLAFDDFGAGQTRLAELAKSPPDYLKFDKSLIHQIHLAPERLHQMLSTFVNAAQDLGIDTLAEGIECSDEAETCRQLGFDFAQGFFYSRPLPIHEIN